MEPRESVVLIGALLAAVTVVGATERFVALDGNEGIPALAIDADITGAEQLRLITTDRGDNIHCDHAVWAEAWVQ